MSKTRNQLGLSLIELLISITIIATILTVIINFYNYSLRQSSIKNIQNKLRFIAKEEMEKLISLPYHSRYLEVFGSFGGKTNFFERDNYIIKSNIVFINPETGDIPETYPLNKNQDTHLKRLTVSVARKDKLGGQVNLVYLKSPS